MLFAEIYIFFLTLFLLFSVKRVGSSLSLSSSGLESPRAKSPPILKLTPSSPDTEELLRSDLDNVEGPTPTSSGATTPTASTKPKSSLLGLYPLAGFLRSRYPSVVGRPSVKSVDETAEGDLENGDALAASENSSDQVGGSVAEDDDEDRRTIRGVAVDGEPRQEGKQVTNGHGANADASQREQEKSHRNSSLSNGIPSAVG